MYVDTHNFTYTYIWIFFFLHLSFTTKVFLFQSLLVKSQAWRRQKPLTPTWPWPGPHQRRKLGYRMKPKDTLWKFDMPIVSNGPAATAVPSQPPPSLWGDLGPWRCTGSESSPPMTEEKVHHRSCPTTSSLCPRLVRCFSEEWHYIVLIGSKYTSHCYYFSVVHFSEAKVHKQEDEKFPGG